MIRSRLKSAANNSNSNTNTHNTNTNTNNRTRKKFGGNYNKRGRGRSHYNNYNNNNIKDDSLKNASEEISDNGSNATSALSFFSIPGLVTASSSAASASGSSDRDNSLSSSSSSAAIQKFNLQFSHKVKESAKELNCLEISAKLEAQSITLNKLVKYSDDDANELMIGRDKEVELLHCRLKTSFAGGTTTTSTTTSTTTTRPRRFIIDIEGESGTGKTVLAKRLAKPARKMGGLFGLGKFDILNANTSNNSSSSSSSSSSAQPYKVFITASYGLAEQLLERKAKEEKEQEQEKKATTTTTTTTTTTEEGVSSSSSSSSSFSSFRKELLEALVGDQGNNNNNNNNNNTTGSGDGLRLLLEVFPGLDKVLLSGGTDDTTSTSTTSTSHPTTKNKNKKKATTTEVVGIEGRKLQLQFVVRQLFRALGNNNKFSPLVLVLDDIQWADLPSLDLLEALCTDPDTSSSFLLVTTRRPPRSNDEAAPAAGEEVEKEKEEENYHPFLQRLLKKKQTQEEGEEDRKEGAAAAPPPAVETIRLTNLDETAVRSVVANALRASEEYVQDLATIVYEKTHGNAYFVSEFLQMLVQENVLQYNLGLMKWLWDNDEIEALPIADNVATLLGRRIQTSLSKPAQVLLTVAACLGQEIEEDNLSVAMMSLVDAKLMQLESISRIFQSKEECLAAGLLQRRLFGSSSSTYYYSFVHDQIQALAFSMIPAKELPMLQLVIGRGLLNHIHRQYHLPNSNTHKRESINENGNDDDDNNNNDDGQEKDNRGDDTLLFLAVDLCNKGSSELGEGGKVELASPNLKAAKLAMHKSAFHAAISYGKAGLECLETSATTLDERKRRKQLDLYTILAEASYCIGDGPGTEAYADKVIDNEFFTKLDDKYVGYVMKMLSQFAQHRLDQAMKSALLMMKELGYFKKLGLVPSTPRVLIEIMKTKSLMKKYTQDQLLNLPPMTDPNRLRAVQTICRTITVAFSAYPNLFLVLALTVMRWTVKYGVSKYSPPIFAVYGLVLCGILEEFDEGTMIGEVALALSEMLQSNQTLGMTTHVTTVFISHWKSDIRKGKKPMQYALRTAWQMGDINNVICLSMSLDQDAFYSGQTDLPELASNFRETVAKTRSFGHESYAVEHSLLLQLMLNLMGRAKDDPLVLTGEAMDQEELIKTATKGKHKLALAVVDMNTGILGYYYENHEYAISHLKKVKKEDLIGHMSMVRHFAYLALTYIALALEGKEPKKNLRLCRTEMKKLNKWVAAGNVNIRHFVSILEAEIAALQSPERAGPLYEEAVKLSGRIFGFRHDKALAHARAARFFFVVQKDDHWGSYHLDRAIHTYNEWGAVGVVENLGKIYLSSASQGQARFSFSNEIEMSATTRAMLQSGSIRC